MLLSVLKVSGHSMEPAILDGQSVLASSVPFFFGKLKEGDIVVFEKDKKLIVKRIKEIKGDKILVYGDNEIDSKNFGWIERENVKGKLVVVI